MSFLDLFRALYHLWKLLCLGSTFGGWKRMRNQANPCCRGDVMWDANSGKVLFEKGLGKRFSTTTMYMQPCTCKSHPLRCRKSGQRSLECNVAGGPGCEAWIGPVHKLTLYPRRSLVLALHKHRLHHQGGRINLFFFFFPWLSWKWIIRQWT